MITKPKIKLTFLGSGSAFTIEDDNFQSNLLLEDLATGKKLLIDCGSDIRWSLKKQGYNEKDIDAIYISHVHADHIGGLEFIGLMRYFGDDSKPLLFTHETILGSLWQSLEPGMATLDTQAADLNTYFKVMAIGNSTAFDWQGYTFELEPTIHVINNGQTLPCYGLKFSINDNYIYFTADTRLMYPSKQALYERATVIFHDCETSQEHSGVHGHYSELLSLPHSIREKIWLYHYNSGEKIITDQEAFKGFVKMGQCFWF